MTMRIIRWACASVLIVIFAAAIACLALGGWKWVTEIWVSRSLMAQGVQVQFISHPRENGNWSLFPRRAYQLVFDSLNPDLRLASRLQRVTDLSFQNLRLDAEDCVALGEVNSLRTLELYRVTLPSAGWQYLGQLSGLESIYLLEMRVDEPGVLSLARMPSLRYLWASHTEFRFSQRLNYDAFRVLQEATFVKCHIEPGFLELIAHAPLEHLDLLQCQFPERAVVYLSELTELRSLSLATDMSGLPVSEVLRSLDGLRSVNLCTGSHADELCQSLATLPDLVEVQINVKKDAGVSDIGVKHLSGLQRLSTLAINAKGVTDVGAEYLRRCFSLRVLRLIDSQISDRGLRAIAQLPELSELFIPGSRISDNGIKAIATSKTLRILDVSRTQITDVSIESIKDCRSLQVLYIRGTNISRQGISVLQRCRPDLAVVHDGD